MCVILQVENWCVLVAWWLAYLTTDLGLSGLTPRGQPWSLSQTPPLICRLSRLLHSKGSYDRSFKFWMWLLFEKGSKRTILSVSQWRITLKMADQGRSDFLCTFYREPLRTWIKTNVNKFAIWSHTTFKLDKQAVRSYLKLTCELHILPNTKVSAAKHHGKNCMKQFDRPWSAIYSVIMYTPSLDSPSVSLLLLQSSASTLDWLCARIDFKDFLKSHRPPFLLLFLLFTF